MMETLLTFLAAITLALVHLLAGRLRFLEVVPRSRWLSLAGGVSVAYVFVHILPDLPAAQNVVAEHVDVFLVVERHVYLIALGGLITFYGLECMVKKSRDRPRQSDEQEATPSGVFWLHMSVFALYNLLVGYLLTHRGSPEEEAFDVAGLLTYTVALGLHFVVNDFGLRQDHRADYHRYGRWLLANAVVVGWAVGMATTLHDVAVSIPFAFLAGGIVMNVLKEELPEER
jgi:hypothetical protein